MIEFEATNLEELEAEARRRAHEISVATLKAVCKGIEEDADVGRAANALCLQCPSPRG